MATEKICFKMKMRDGEIAHKLRALPALPADQAQFSHGSFLLSVTPVPGF